MSKLQCQSLTQTRRQCKFSTLNGSNYCKRHKDILIQTLSESKIESDHLLCPKLDPDTELLIFGYLLLEDILTVFRDNHKTRDKIIKIHNFEIPCIEYSIQNKNLETLKYLIELGKEELPHNILTIAVIFGGIKIFQYLVGLRKVETFPDQSILNLAIDYGQPEIVKFIMSLGIKNLKPSKDNLFSACRNLEILEFLVNLGGIKPTKSLFYEVAENLDIFKYLLKLKIFPNIAHLEHYSRSSSTEMIQYLIENNFAINNKILQQYAFRGLLDMLKLASEKGHNMCWRILKSAVKGNQYQVCKYLLDIGVKPRLCIQKWVSYKNNLQIRELFASYKYFIKYLKCQ